MALVTAAMGKRQRVVVGVVSAALGVLVAEPLAGTAALLPATPTLSAPTVQRAMTVPSVTAPAATVPSVSTPLATTPKVTTPSVTTPSATTPSVTTPRVSTPSVTTPAVHTPVGSVPSASVPSASAPSVSAPSRSVPAGAVRSTGSGSSGTAGSRANATSGAATGASPASGATSTSGLGSAASRSSAGLAPASGGTGESRRVGAGPSAQSPRQRARAKRLAADRNSRRLRHQVARLRGCLHTLQPGARRLLALRAGLNGPARSAQATARILHVSDTRETRLERRALRALQRSVVTGCAAPAAAVPATAPGIPAGQGTAAGTAAVSSVAADPAATAASLSSVQAHRAPRGGRRLPGVAVPRVTNVEQAVAGSSSVNGVVLAAVLALLLGLGLIALPEMRRRVLPARAATGAVAEARPARRSPQVPAAGARNGRGASTAAMDEALAPMAADVFARLTHDPAAPGSHAQREGDAESPHPEAEDED